MIYVRIPFHHLIRISFFIRILLYLLILLLSLCLYYFQVLHFNIQSIVFLISVPLSLCLLYFFTPVRTLIPVSKYNIIVLYIDAMMLNLLFYTLNPADFLNVYGAYMILVITGNIFFVKYYRILYCIYITTCYTGYVLFHTYLHGTMDTNTILSLVSGDVLIVLSAAISYIYTEFINSFRHLASLGQISVELAHEVRNPLQIIETYAERGVSEPSILAEIQNQVDKVARFIQELLSLGSENSYNPRKENITHLIDYAVSLLQSIPGYMDHIRFHKDIITKDLIVNVDVEQITKILTNIMRNGIEAMKKGGNLTITVQKQGGEWAQISISDTGIGIDEMDLKKIFQPFYTTKRGTRGTGLGLALVKKFVKTNKGTIDVFSQNGQGATFILKLPLA